MKKLPKISDLINFDDEIDIEKEDDFDFNFQNNYKNTRKKMLSKQIKEPMTLDELKDYFEPCSTVGDNYQNTIIINGWTGLFNLDLILSYGIEKGASDIHIQPFQEICYTINKDIVKMPEFGIPDEEVTNDMINGITKEAQSNIYIRDFEFDFNYTIRFGPHKGHRFRTNIGKSFTNDCLVFRNIAVNMPSYQDLGVPEQLLEWSSFSSGIWLIGGATGSGKSTTLSSIVEYIQDNNAKKIITIEKPIEYQYDISRGQSLIIQREVGSDTHSFANGLTSAMRQMPDIILIGEVRNYEEISELIRAAETGHLAISTIHTKSVTTTINRILSLFSPEEQNHIKDTLSDTLIGLVNQILIKRKDGNGMIACHEVLTITEEIRKYIKNGDINSIKQYLRANNLSMEQNILKKYLENIITVEKAIEQAPDREFMIELLNFVQQYNEMPTFNEFGQINY